MSAQLTASILVPGGTVFCTGTFSEAPHLPLMPEPVRIGLKGWLPRVPGGLWT